MFNSAVTKLSLLRPVWCSFLPVCMYVRESYFSAVLFWYYSVFRDILMLSLVFAALLMFIFFTLSTVYHFTSTSVRNVGFYFLLCLGYLWWQFVNLFPVYYYAYLCYPHPLLEFEILLLGTDFLFVFALIVFFLAVHLAALICYVSVRRSFLLLFSISCLLSSIRLFFFSSKVVNLSTLHFFSVCFPVSF